MSTLFSTAFSSWMVILVCIPLHTHTWKFIHNTHVWLPCNNILYRFWYILCGLIISLKFRRQVVFFILHLLDAQKVDRYQLPTEFHCLLHCVYIHVKNRLSKVFHIRRISGIFQRLEYLYKHNGVTWGWYLSLNIDFVLHIYSVYMYSRLILCRIFSVSTFWMQLIIRMRFFT